MKNFYRRGMIVIMFLITLGLFILILISRADANPIAYKPKGIFQQQINGVVTSQTGKPLIGVTVLVKNQMRGTVSNSRGEYEIVANPNDTLVFSFVGYRTQETPVNGRTAISIQLAEGISSLDEVEINAGYYNVTQRERTGNISRVTAEEIEKQPVLDPLAAIQGRMPGVEIIQTTGVPGGRFEIKIRGTNSLRSEGNQPLYIIDGVPYSNTRLSDTNLTGQITGFGESPIDLLSPNDIKSIEVLKDADATAIYGSRGANGVVLITTKKGDKGKVTANFNISSGWAKTASKIGLLKTPEYIMARKEAFANDGFTELPFYAYDINGTWDSTRYTNWQEKLIGNTGKTYNIRGNVSGGSDLTNFIISGSYQKQTTVFPGDYSYDRASVHFNINHQSEDERFKLSLSGTYTADKNNQPAVDFTREALMLPPNAPEIYNEDGTLNWENSTWTNPLRNMETSYDSKSRGLISNLVLDYELFKNFHAKTSFGFTQLDHDEITTFPSTIYDPAYGVTSASSYAYANKAANQAWIIEPQLNYDWNLGKHEFKILAGATFQENNYEKFVQLGYSFPNNDLITNLAAASSFYIVNKEDSQYRYNAVFGRLNYKFDDRYILNLTGRRDGSSRFGPGKRFSNFSAVGFAWLFGNEQLFEDSFLSFGKLRTSYGTTGSDNIGDYQYLDTYTITSGNYNGITGLLPSRLFNPDFSWESNRKFEVGLELAFLRNRLFFQTSFFRNRSSNQLVGIPLPATTGFSSIQANLGATVENKGWELELNYQIFQNEKFSWNTSMNVTIPENKLIAFPGLENSTYANQYVIGQPLDIRKVYHYEGINSQSGLYTFTDYNQDGTISATEDRKAIANYNTKFYGGLQNRLSLGNFSLDFLFQFTKQTGRDAFNYLAFPMAVMNQPEEVLDRWQTTGDNAQFQKYTAGYNSEAITAFSQFRSSDAVATDASFIRLKNLSFSYAPVSIKGMRTRFYLQGQNLWTISKYLGLDPETQSTFGLPPLKVITVGLDVSF